MLVDTGANRDFVSERFVERNNLRSFAASVPMNATLAVGKWLTANRLVAMTIVLGPPRQEQARRVTLKAQQTRRISVWKSLTYPRMGRHSTGFG